MRKGIKRFAALAAFVLPLAALTVIPGAAVNATGAFELDGDASSSTTVSGPPDDWDRVCHQVTGTDCSTPYDTNGAVAVEYVHQPANNATTFSGGGSKDPHNTSDWAWESGTGGSPGKDILLDGFAARYSLTATPASGTCPNGTNPYDSTVPCRVLFFGMDRFDNAGDAQNGFWFFQNKITLGNNKVGGGTGFSGLHQNGDVLVVSDFSIGGTISTMTVYRWDTSCAKTGATSSDGHTCGDANLATLGTSDAARCDLSAQNAGFCGIVNPTNGTTSPWPFTDKTGHSAYQQGEFYEGGINLSLLGLAGECFASTLAETRSSTSTTAVLKVFILGQLGNCVATMSTTPSNTTNPVTPGTPVHDTATVVGNQATVTPAGTVTFSLCSFAVGSTGVCDGTTNVGTVIGTGTLSGSGSTATATSPDVNTLASPLTPGHYCFFASWPGDNNYTTPLTADGSQECFDVAKIPSSISTTQSVYPNDSATVSTAAGTVSGSVAFSLFSNATCTGTALYSQTVLVGGSASETANTTNTSVSVNTAGPFYWLVQFTPSDPLVHEGRQSACVENVSPSFINDAGPGTLYP